MELAHVARAGACAGFHKFSKKKFHASRARRAHVGLTVYPPWIQIRDVAPSRSRRDHRKSKFGLRHDIKLILALCRDEVRIWIFDDPAENERGQRPGSGSREGKLSNPRGRAARAMHGIFFSKIYEIPRTRLRGQHALVPPLNSTVRDFN